MKDFSWVDETTEFTDEDWERIKHTLRRVRSISGIHLDIRRNWFYQFFKKPVRPFDNPRIPPRFQKRRRKSR